MSDKRYYWLKLKRDFFKRHDIRIIEAMPNGKDYILFYLKLLCESIDHDGNLRFSEKIPYSETMLATLTDTNVDIVRSAIKVFSELGMMEVLDDGTYFMSEVERLVGSETDWAVKKRIYRENHPVIEDKTRTKKDNVRQEKEIEIEKEIEKDIKVRRFTPPTTTEVQQYCSESGHYIDAEAFVDFYESKNWMVGKNKMKDWKSAVRNWERRDKEKPHTERTNRFNNFEQQREEIDPYALGLFANN